MGTRATAAALLLLLTATITGQDHTPHRLNPVIGLLEQNKPVFGVYAPSNGGRRGEPATARPAIDLAKDAIAYTSADFLFNGSMEGGLDRAWSGYTDFVT